MAKDVYTSTGTPIERILPGVTLWQPNTTVYRDLDVNSVIEELHIKVTGHLQLAGYTAAPTVRVNGIENLIRNISFIGAAKTSGNPTVNLSNVDANYLRLKTAIVQGTWPDRTDVGTANGGYDFETNFTKYFGCKRTNVGGLTYLDARRFQSLRINFDTRDVTALVHGGANGTATLTNVQITISQKERAGSQFQNVNPYVRETRRDFDLTNYGGIDKDFLNIPLGNRLVRQYIMGFSGDVNYAEPSDALFATNLKQEGAHIKTLVYGSGGTLSRFDDEYTHIVSKNRARFKLEDFPAGVAVLEYSPTGIVGDMLDLRTGGSKTILSAKNQLDLTVPNGVTNTLSIYDEELVAN